MLAGVHWGDVPTWVASVLTGGSLLLGLTLLKNDRVKETREQASKVVAWYSRDVVERERNITAVTFSCSNHSEQPIYDVFVMARQYTPGRVRQVQTSIPPDRLQKMYPRLFDPSEAQYDVFTPERDDGPSSPILRPGEEVTFPGELWAPVWYFDIDVRFTDARGARWVRDLDTGTLERFGKKHRPRAST